MSHGMPALELKPDVADVHGYLLIVLVLDL
jgi:hypothetical protein